MIKGILKTSFLVIILGGLVYSGFFFYDTLLAKGEIAEVRNRDQTLSIGDIIFQISQSQQSIAIQLATHSKYSHCGLIYWKNGQCYVLEASNEVTFTPIDEFIQKGKDSHYVVKRLKNSKDVFTSSEVLEKMSKTIYDKYLGKPYDIYFGWSDDKIYCSELVWKLYENTLNIEVGNLEKLKDFDLSDTVVKNKLKERYGDSIPVNETVISPSSIFNCEKLETILSN